jgi:hypothetical protein
LPASVISAPFFCDPPIVDRALSSPGEFEKKGSGLSLQMQLFHYQ